MDTGPNANITYSLVKSSDQSSDRFDIDPVTGIIKTANVFDREAQIGVTDYGVTVKAEDQGSQKLAGFCTFRIKIGDKNDNPPVFNLPHYTASIEERSVVGKRVKQVYATDRDAGNNAKVEYFLQEDPSGFFTIDQYTGWITIAKPMSGVLYMHTYYYCSFSIINVSICASLWETVVVTSWHMVLADLSSSPI